MSQEEPTPEELELLRLKKIAEELARQQLATNIRTFITVATPLVLSGHMTHVVSLLGTLIDERKIAGLSKLPADDGEREMLRDFFDQMFKNWCANLLSMEDFANDPEWKAHIHTERLNQMDLCCSHLLFIHDLHQEEIDLGLFQVFQITPCFPHGTVLCPLIDYFLDYFDNREIESALAALNTDDGKNLEEWARIETFVSKTVLKLCFHAFDKSERLGKAIIIFADIFTPEDMKRAVEIHRQHKKAQRQLAGRFDGIDMTPDEISTFQRDLFE